MYVLFIVPLACFSLRGLLQSEFYMLNVIVIMGGGGGGGRGRGRGEGKDGVCGQQ